MVLSIKCFLKTDICNSIIFIYFHAFLYLRLLAFVRVMFVRIIPLLDEFFATCCWWKFHQSESDVIACVKLFLFMMKRYGFIVLNCFPISFCLQSYALQGIRKNKGRLPGEALYRLMVCAWRRRGACLS